MVGGPATRAGQPGRGQTALPVQGPSQPEAPILQQGKLSHSIYLYCLPD